MVRRHLARIGALAALAVGGVGIAAALAPTSGATLTTPGAPTGLAVALGRTVGEVRLTWTAPADTGGGIGSYSIASATVTGGVTGTWSTPRTTGSTSTRATRTCEATYPSVCAYRVSAVNSAGTSTASTPAQVVWAVPSAASRLRATPVDAHTFTANDLAWAAPARTGGLAVTYDVQIKVDAGAWTDIATDLSARVLNDDAHCTGGTSCLYRVRAKNAVGYGPNSNSSALAVRPTAVTALTAEITAVDPTLSNALSGSASVTLTWDVPRAGLADGNFQFAGCLDTCDATHGTWTANVPVANATHTTTVPCAAEYRTCTYRVRATNTLGGVGAWSYRTLTPFAPRAVSAATGTAEDTILVTFNGPADTGTGAIGDKHFEFTVCSSSCASAGNWASDPTENVALGSIAGFPATVPVGCPGGSTCQVRVQFVDGDDHQGPLSGVASAVAAALPADPTGLTVTSGSVADHVSASWTASSPAGTPALTTYQYRQSDDGTAWGSWTSTGSTATTASIPCGGGGVDCYVEVRALNAIGTSGATDPDSAVSATLPGQLAGLAATVDVVTGHRDLTWDTAYFYEGVPGYTDVQYRVRIGAGSYSAWASTGTTSGSYTDTTGCGGTDVCTYQVRAVNAVGAGAASTAATATLVPGAPTLTASTGTVEAHMQLSWTAPTQLGIPALTDYEYRISTDGLTWGSWTSTGSTSTTANVDCAAGGVTCYAEVRAVNTAGAGDASNSDSATTATVPGQLVLTSADPSATAGSVDLVWETAYFYAGFPSFTDVEFRVRIGSGSYGSWTSTGTTSGAYTDSSCGVGNVCVYQVRAVNAVGAGLASNEATNAAAPAAPSSFTATYNSGSTDLAWTIATPLPALTNVEYRQRLNGGSWSGWFGLGTTGSSTSISACSTTSSDTCDYQIRGVNSVGSGAASTIEGYTVP